MSRSKSKPRRTVTDIEFLILQALTLEALYGFKIVKEVEHLTKGARKLNVASLYDALHRLQRAKLIERCGEEIVDGRARRTYQITHSGLAAIHDKEQELRELNAVMRRAKSAAAQRAEG